MTKSRRSLRLRPVDERLYHDCIAAVNNCILYGGQHSGSGYGQIWNNGRLVSVHRLAYELAHGPIPDGHVVRHTCDTRRCINPHHLESGTQQENIRDCINRGRRADIRGERHCQARLSNADVQEIRRLHIPRMVPSKQTGRSRQELAERFGVTPHYITRLVTDKEFRQRAEF